MFSTEDDKVSSDSLEVKGKGIITTLTDINKAINDTFLEFKATSNVFENFTKVYSLNVNVKSTKK